uniref:Uncharacterized protein n=1 Tax=Rhizophora mucronata TaxID=61149 RepID=A0A2P2IKW9_RHIMU
MGFSMAIKQRTCHLSKCDDQILLNKTTLLF